MSRGEELKPEFKKTTLTSIKGKRSVIVTSLIKTQATPGEHLHGLDTRTKLEPVHHPGHACAVL